MLAPFFASFIIMNCVFFLVKLIPFLNFVLDLNIGFADFIRLFSYLFPNIFLYSIPMAAMMGVTIGFARLSSDSEILAFKASGISMYQILPPVILVASLIALLTAFVSIKLIPISEISMKKLTYQLLKEKVNEGVKEHVFTEALGQVVVYIDKIDKESGEWKDVWVSDMRGVDNPVITMASSGSMHSSINDMMITIVLHHGSLHRPSNESAQIVQFQTYQIKIPLQPPDSKNTRLKRSAYGMSELLEEARAVGINNEEYRKILIEFHKRIVLPVGCLIISLIGLPLGLQARPGKRAIGIQAGLIIFVLYYIMYTVGKSVAEGGALPVVVAIWAPNVLFFVLALFWIVRITNEQALLPETITRWLGSVINKGLDYITQKCQQQWLKLKNRYSVEEQVHDETEINLPAVIRGNPKSKVFHLPKCEYYDCRNCTLEFKNIQVALDAGFEPCRLCKDLIELYGDPTDSNHTSAKQEDSE
jgi:lipopolysaccharide export system permease protein